MVRVIAIHQRNFTRVLMQHSTLDENTSTRIDGALRRLRVSFDCQSQWIKCETRFARQGFREAKGTYIYKCVQRNGERKKSPKSFKSLESVAMSLIPGETAHLHVKHVALVISSKFIVAILLILVVLVVLIETDRLRLHTSDVLQWLGDRLGNRWWCW